MPEINDFYQPTEQEKHRCQALTAIIRQHIVDQGGAIPFSTFMELALYHPMHGYYTAKGIHIGAHGDFTTAPELSPLFAQCIANQCLSILKQPDTSDILELGPGSGRLASDLLSHLKQLDCVPSHYYLYEVSPTLRQQQQDFLTDHHPDLICRIHWLDELPEHFQGVVIGNEVLDALPVDRFQMVNGDVIEHRVTWDNDQFAWENHPAETSLSTDVAELNLPQHYTSEHHRTLPGFVQQISQCLSKGLILLFDYGYGRAEYYHPERRHGTLTCFIQHRKHDNPLVLPGLQDITAHVDFTRVIEVASETGCDLAGFTTQAGFLLANNLVGLHDAATKDAKEEEIFTINQAIKTLTLPTDMGETIKVMGLSKAIPTPLPTLCLQDRRRDL